jgi:hypothetical protein
MTNQAIHTAIETARRKVANNAAWTRSVEKAAAALVAGEIICTVLVDGGLVSSPRGTYRIKNGVCSCPAGQNGLAHCYHKSALRIVEIAETAPAPSPRVPRITRSVERNYNGPRLTVYRVDGWAI